MGLCFLASEQAVHAAAPTVSLSAGIYTVQFGDEDDVVSFSYDTQGTGFILLQQDPNHINEPGTPLLFNGQPLLMSDVKKMVIDLGAGNDKLLEPQLQLDELWIYGGDGNDVIKVPNGLHTTHVYGGRGDDVINAEHSGRDRTNYLYGEDGDDQLSGSSDGENVLDGGPGNNHLIVFPDTWDPAVVQTIIFHPGDHDTVLDTGGPTVYKFISSGLPEPTGGSLSILESVNQGDDTLDFSQWKHPINVDLASIAPQKVSVDNPGNTLLTLELQTYPNRIEKILYPSLPTLPDIALTKSANPATVVSGGITTFSIQYQNTGSADASGVLVTDTIPTGSTLVAGSITAPPGVTFSLNGNTITWSVGTVAAGAVAQSVSFKVIAQ